VELVISTSSENETAGSAGWPAYDLCPDKPTNDCKYKNTEYTTHITTGQNE
jgi:hypothetical protein